MSRLAAWLLPADPAQRARRDRVLAFLFLVLCVVLVARAAREDAGVIVRNREFGARFLAGADPYFDPARGQRIHGPYPPTLVWIAAPLALLPLVAARIAWALLQVGALFVCWRIARRWTQRFWPALAPHASVIFAAGLLLSSRYLLRDTAGGGGNLVFATLVVLALEFAWQGRELVAGLPLALSLALKPNLALFVLFFALRGKWKPLVSAAAVACVLWLVPALGFGVARWNGLGIDWARSVVRYGAIEDLNDSALVPDGLPEREGSMNQSLREAVDRLFVPGSVAGAVDVHVANLGPHVAAWIARALSVLFFACVLVALLRARDRRSEMLVALALFPLSLLLSPITWKAHHVALLPLFCVLVCEALGQRRRWLAWLLAVYYLACVLLAEELVGKHAKTLLQSLSLVTWGAVVLLFAAWILSRSPALTRAVPRAAA